MYGEPLKGAYGGELPSVIMQQVVTMGFELIDGGTIAHRLFPATPAEALAPGLPAKQYLAQMSVDDALVTNLSTLLWARTAELPLLSPAVQEPFGVTPTAGPLASALVIYDEEPTPAPPVSNLATARATSPTRTCTGGRRRSIRSRASSPPATSSTRARARAVRRGARAARCRSRRRRRRADRARRQPGAGAGAARRARDLPARPRRRRRHAARVAARPRGGAGGARPGDRALEAAVHGGRAAAAGSAGGGDRRGAAPRRPRRAGPGCGSSPAASPSAVA
ncbi:MAG: hypothetical protein R2939_10795 [Kofleriaceae bacterium]